MKKQLVIIGIVTILVSVGLSGCNESQTSGDSSKVQLVDYTVETYGWDYGYQYKKIGDGFVHNVYDQGRYVIKGSIKNIAVEMLNTIKITANFYDKNNIFLVSATDTIGNLPESYTGDFEVIYDNSDSYYYDIDHVEFKLQTS
jgi:hypothetical protein